MLKTVGLFILTPLVLIGCAERHADPSENSEHILTQTKGAILQAKGVEALNLITRADKASLSSEDLAFLACVKERFLGSESTHTPDLSSALAIEILPLFRAYWTKAIMDKEGRHQAELELLNQLSIILEIDDPEVIEPMIIKRLQSDGLNALMGRTGQLRELMIWQTQSEEIEQVELPDGSVNTTVFYLDEFISNGWSSYFSCNTLGTGGWAQSDGLYVVMPRWKRLDEERFRVSLLAHESQHFQDYLKFPDIAGWELEYRAKLVELALANVEQARLIKRFTANQGSDEGDAHSYANRKVVTDLRTYLRLEVSDLLEFDSTSVIQKAAVDLLKRDSRERKNESAVE